MLSCIIWKGSLSAERSTQTQISHFKPFANKTHVNVHSNPEVPAEKKKRNNHWRACSDGALPRLVSLIGKGMEWEGIAKEAMYFTPGQAL